MHIFGDLLKLNPREFELFVKEIIDATAGQLVDYSSEHAATFSGADGNYVIDVVATFSALGAKFVVLVECKHLNRPVERQEVQILHSKLQSLNAQKAMLFSVSGFQSGAIEYATAHGIALIHVASGASTWHTRAFGPTKSPPSFIPKHVGWLLNGNQFSAVSSERTEYLRAFFGLN